MKSALLALALHLMPLPAKIEMGPGRLAVKQTFAIAITGFSDPRITASASRFLSRLGRQTGMPFNPASAGLSAGAALVVHCEHAGAAVQALGEDESYRLQVAPTQARLSAPNALGILRGLETFLQLVEPGADGFAVPALTVDDRPRFAWRGLSLDVCRHWMPLDVVLRTLDGMAAVKLNVFHWHLSDDQGFRIESRRYPKLHLLGSAGLFYTQDQVRQVLAAARERGIRVVPEFDMPAHFTAGLAAYPEFGSAPGPYEIGRHWGLFEPALDPSRDAVYSFIDGLIGEMAGLFPDAYFHTGGDEVNGKQWNESRPIQAFMKQQGLRDNAALQAYFNRRVEAIVRQHGKRMEGWDEMLEPALPREILIQSWRGRKSLAEAARQGYQGLLSAPYYLDHMKTAADMYLSDPLEKETASLTPQEQKRILGGEVCAWTEFMTAENIDSRIWPRTAAIAERFWSPQDVNDVDSMYQRLDAVSLELETLGLRHASNYRMMLERLAGPGGLETMRVLADVVAPVRLGGRIRARQYTQDTPLNRLCDAARPESAAGRNFLRLAAQVAGGHGDHQALRLQLTAWSGNDARFERQLNGNSTARELSPVSATVAALARAGLQALDFLDHGKRPPPAWLKQQRLLLEDAKKPQAELIIQIVPGVQKLVDASAARPAGAQNL